MDRISVKSPAAVDMPSASKSSIDSTFPVVLPEDDALIMSDARFERRIQTLLSTIPRPAQPTGNEKGMAKMALDNQNERSTTSGEDTSPTGIKVLDHAAQSASSFMTGLSNVVAAPPKQELKSYGHSMPLPDNMMYTENKGLAHKSTTSPLLDLFTELEKTVSGPRLRALLDSAWNEDALATLKIIWNARSIHLGKGEQDSFYRCLGWLKDEHPKTVLVNLQWLVRPIIEKKVKKEDDEAAVVIQKEDFTMDGEFNVRHGVSHGYWKDLLNLLVLSVNQHLDVEKEPNMILRAKNQHKVPKMPISEHELVDLAEITAWEKQATKDAKHELENTRHKHAKNRLQNDPFYHALHLTVARLFATQLKKDLDLEKSEAQMVDLNGISLAAKWAPSLEGFHDKHTFIVSSITWFTSESTILASRPS